MGSDAKNLMSDGNVQNCCDRRGHWRDANFTEGELIVEAGERACTVVTGCIAESGNRWIQMHTVAAEQWVHAIGQRRCHCHRYCSVRGGAIVSTLATVNGRHPEGEFSVDKGYACGLLLEKWRHLRTGRTSRGKNWFDQEGHQDNVQPQRSW